MNEQVSPWECTSLDNGFYIFSVMTMMTTIPEEDYKTTAFCDEAVYRKVFLFYIWTTPWLLKIILIQLENSHL